MVIWETSNHDSIMAMINQIGWSDILFKPFHLINFHAVSDLLF